MKKACTLLRDLLFSVAITCISRGFIARDQLFGRLRRLSRMPAAGSAVSRHSIPSGTNCLDAVLVTPTGAPVAAGVLLCHGIGETVEHWAAVQHLLAARGVASFVFDYSGYGRSSGFISAHQCEQDAIAALQFLRRRLPSSALSVLGFSLGSGIAASIVTEVAVDRLILCAAFTSLREAARCIGLPKFLAFLVPPIWDATALRQCPVPVLIVHGEKDQLFPVQMALDLKNLCSAQSELVIVPNHLHNQPFYRPQCLYWDHIVWYLVGASRPEHDTPVPQTGPSTSTAAAQSHDS